MPTFYFCNRQRAAVLGVCVYCVYVRFGEWVLVTIPTPEIPSPRAAHDDIAWIERGNLWNNAYVRARLRSVKVTTLTSCGEKKKSAKKAFATVGQSWQVRGIIGAYSNYIKVRVTIGGLHTRTVNCGTIETFAT